MLKCSEAWCVAYAATPRDIASYGEDAPSFPKRTCDNGQEQVSTRRGRFAQNSASCAAVWRRCNARKRRATEVCLTKRRITQTGHEEQAFSEGNYQGGVQHFLCLWRHRARRVQGVGDMTSFGNQGFGFRHFSRARAREARECERNSVNVVRCAKLQTSM